MNAYRLAYPSRLQPRRPDSTRRLSPPVSALVVLGALSCRTPNSGDVSGSMPTAETQEPSDATSSRATAALLADVAPIRALAHDGTYLWVGSTRGLRRVRVATNEAEWVDVHSGFTARQVTALAVDRGGTVWVGTEVGVGVFEAAPAGPYYRAIASRPGVTRVVPIAATRTTDDAWVGTETGLLTLKGATFTPVAAATGDVVTSLDADSDGHSAWVGLRTRGLLRVDATSPSPMTAVGPSFAGSLDFIDPIGTVVLPNGTRFAIGRAAAGGTRLVMLSARGPVLMTSQSELNIQAVVDGAPSGQVIAGSNDAPKRFQLLPVDRGENVADGAVRFSPAHKSLDGLRMVAQPIGAVGIGSVTVAIQSEGDLFVGSQSSGTARSTSKGNSVLPTGELALNATGLSVACVDPQRCFVATGTGTGWTWSANGRGLSPLAATLVGGRLMTLAGTGDGPTFSVAGDPGTILRVARLSSDGTRFDPIAQIPVALAGSESDTKGAVIIATNATVSPKGNLWIAVRQRMPSGRDSGRGVIELQLPSGHVVHHRPYRKGERAPGDVIPVDGDVRAIRFQSRSTAGAASNDSAPARDAMWFCTTSGIFRFSAGDLSRWGENNGLESEHCNDLRIADDGLVWAATSAGAASFDGNIWKPAAQWPRSQRNQDDEPLGARSLVAIQEHTWAGTPRGLLSLTKSSAQASTNTMAPIDNDIVSSVSDRFGRVWILGQSGVTLLESP